MNRGLQIPDRQQDFPAHEPLSSAAVLTTCAPDAVNANFLLCSYVQKRSAPAQVAESGVLCLYGNLSRILSSWALQKQFPCARGAKGCLILEKDCFYSCVSVRGWSYTGSLRVCAAASLKSFPCLCCLSTGVLQGCCT